MKLVAINLRHILNIGHPFECLSGHLGCAIYFSDESIFPQSGVGLRSAC
jgi:hypothetical protein